MTLTTRLLALAAVALVVGYLLGSRGGSADQADQASSTAAEGGTEPAQLWSLVDETRAEAGDDTERQSELLEERLSRLSGEQILEFAKMRRRLDQEAYSWDLGGGVRHQGRLLGRLLPRLPRVRDIART